MKKLAVLFMTLLFVVSLAQIQAQPKKAERVQLKMLEGKVVSATAKESFTTDFGNIPNVKWARVNTFDEATFVKNGQKMTAYYDVDGKLVGTSQGKSFSDLPSNAQKEIKDKYGKYTIGPIIFYDDNEANDTDMILWNVQFDDEDNYFVELTNGAKKLIVRVDPNGKVSQFTEAR